MAENLTQKWLPDGIKVYQVHWPPCSFCQLVRQRQLLISRKAVSSVYRQIHVAPTCSLLSASEPNRIATLILGCASTVSRTAPVGFSSWVDISTSRSHGYHILHIDLHGRSLLNEANAEH